MYIRLILCFFYKTTVLTSTDLLGGSLGYPIVERTIWHCRIDSVTRVVVLRGRQRCGLDVQKGGQLTPAIGPVTASREAWTKRERSLAD